MDNHNRRVVITGMGVVAPNGIGVDNFWSSLIHMRSGVGQITRFDASSYPIQIAAEINNFDPYDYMDESIVKRLDRYVHYSLASASMAIKDSELRTSHEDPFRVGVYTATAIGGGETIEIQHTIFVEKGLKKVSPFALRGISTHTAAAAICNSFCIKGPNTTISSGCNSGLDASYMAYNAVRFNDADVMVVAAGEAPITPFIIAAFSSVGILSKSNGDPKRAIKPYDKDANGTLLGEGGGAIVIEELSHALKRGAKIYGEIVGYSSVNEAYIFGTQTDPDAMAKAFRGALEKAQLPPTDIDYINAHGNAIQSYDIGETETIKKVFGEHAYRIPVTSIKPNTGQSLSPTGIYQIITALLAMKNKVIPPTMNHKNPCLQCDLNYVPNLPLKKEVNVALINAHGFGGIHTVFIVKKFGEGQF